MTLGKVLVLVLSSYLFQAVTSQNTSETTYKYCTDHIFCNSNGFCYEDSVHATIKFCSCKDDYFGKSCEKKYEKFWEQLVYVLSCISALFLATIIVAAYLLLNQHKGNSKEYKSHGESWTAVKISQQQTSQMYSRPLDVDLEINDNTSPTEKSQHSDSQFDVVDNTLNQTANTFLPINEDEEDNEIESENGKSISSENAESVQDSTIILIDHNNKLRTTSQSSELTVSTQENLNHSNRNEEMGTFTGRRKNNNLIPPQHQRFTSQDSNDMQNMDEIFKNLYADYSQNQPSEQKRISAVEYPANGKDQRRISTGQYPSNTSNDQRRSSAAQYASNGNGQNRISSGQPPSIVKEQRRISTGQPYNTRGHHMDPQTMRTFPRGYVDRYGRPLSPRTHNNGHSHNLPSTSSTLDRRSKSPNSPTRQQMLPSTLDRRRPHDQQTGGQYHKQRSPRVSQGQMSNQNDYTDTYGRARSMGDLEMIGLAPGDNRRNRAHSLDNLDAVSVNSNVQNIHTGRISRVDVSPKQQGHQRQGKGIWARSQQGN